MIENISKNLNAAKKKNARRPGRGISAGQGKTAGRGTKGQKSRAGHNIPNRFEGGQTVLSMRLPKLPGFKSKKKKNIVVSLDEISEKYSDGDTVSPESLVKKGLIRSEKNKVKILNNGKLTVSVKFENVLLSKNAALAKGKSEDKPKSPIKEATKAKA